VTCPERIVLLQWLDGELSPSEAEAVFEHIENCDRCRGFVSAQKHMESVWRESWVDPSESEFSVLHNALPSAAPWWKTPRVWYIAAAVCAAYIGVKIFYINGAGTPLANIVQQETYVEQIPAHEEQVDEEHSGGIVASPVEELDSSLELEEVQMEVLPAEACEILLSDQPVLPPASRTEGSEVQDEIEASESPEGSADTAGISSVSFQEHLQNQSDSFFADVVPEESGRLYQSTVSGAAASVDVDDSVTAGAGGGGGGLAEGTAGFAQASAPNSQYEETAAENSLGSPVYTVTITLESGEAFGLNRNDWPSVYELVDELGAKNCYSFSDSFVLRVGTDGTVHGDSVPGGTVINVPDERYGNCELTVLFH